MPSVFAQSSSAQHHVFYGSTIPQGAYVTITNHHGTGYTTLPVWVSYDAPQGEDNYDGEHWKTEEAISIDSPDGTSSEYRRAVDACALARSRLNAATAACGSLGAGLYALRPPLEDAGLVIGEVEGWRIWHAGDLRSIAQNFHWKRDGVTEADQEPKEENSSGLWAFKTRELLNENFPAAYSNEGYVRGRVKMWGKIVEHEFGYRAQYAKIEELLEEKRSESYEFINGSPTDTASPDTLASKSLVDHYKQVRMLSIVSIGIASVVIILNTIRFLAVFS